jgi:hypothetical protein
VKILAQFRYAKSPLAMTTERVRTARKLTQAAFQSGQIVFDPTGKVGGENFFVESNRQCFPIQGNGCVTFARVAIAGWFGIRIGI